MENIQPGSSGVKTVTRMEIYNMAKQSTEKEFTKKLDFVAKYYTEKACFPVYQKEDFLLRFNRMKSDMKSRWQAAYRSEAPFLSKNKDWLEGTVIIPTNVECGHRTSKCFEDLCDRSKRRKTQVLRENNETQEILFAGQMMLRESGNISGANTIKHIMNTSSAVESHQESFEKCNASSTSARKLTPQQALSMFVEASLTKKQYEIIRECDKSLFPCYSVIQQEKKKSYPSEESINVTSVSAEIKLQALLNHTVERLLSYLDDVLDVLSQEEQNSLELIYKWGCDGSHQRQYKQTFENNTYSDAHIFQSSLVPLRLICNLNGKVIWQNPVPSSPRYCRPMRIRFVHESKDITTEEIDYFNKQIKELQTTKSKRGSRDIAVTHTMLLTMVDVKVCNAATETASTMKCFICKKTSKDFNTLANFTEELDLQNLGFGLSVLHARIRLFESLLHISYKLNVKKWYVKSQEDKNSVKEKKAEIQEKFREELGLIVDFPKPGFGSSNDGNTSRRFFANSEASARITGIDKTLIDRFATVLEVISSGHEIDLEKFSSYCKETSKLYVQLYPWQPMTPTVHKILVHSAAVIKHALLPIGSLSEEAAEARNKHFRTYREGYSRKFSRKLCNTDVLNRLLLTSDPFLSSVRKKPSKKNVVFSETARDMFLPYKN